MQANLCLHAMCFKMTVLINEKLNKIATTEKMTKIPTTNTVEKGRAPKASGFRRTWVWHPLITKQAPTGERNS